MATPPPTGAVTNSTTVDTFAGYVSPQRSVKVRRIAGRASGGAAVCGHVEPSRGPPVGTQQVAHGEGADPCARALAAGSAGALGPSPLVWQPPPFRGRSPTPSACRAGWLGPYPAFPRI